jgi:hypothetical protein
MKSFLDSRSALLVGAALAFFLQPAFSDETEAEHRGHSHVHYEAPPRPTGAAAKGDAASKHADKAAKKSSKKSAKKAAANKSEKMSSEPNGEKK